MKRTLFIMVALVAFYSCNQPKERDQKAQADPLPSWELTKNKQAIVDFVTWAVDTTSQGYIAPADRIAVFDNDGTLWCEQPLYFEMIYSVEATAQMAAKSPELQKKPELKALATGDKAAFMKSGEKGIMEAFAISHTMVKPNQFDKMASAWLDTTKHERFGHKYVELTYKPMVELLDYLRANGFTTYIVSGGSSMFIRLFSESAYGIPTGQVIGTMFKAKWDDASREVSLTTDVWHVDDSAGKPEAIFNLIGKKPVLAFGNSDGDLQMLEWTSANPLPHICLYLHHTDAEREYAYDRTSAIGKLDKGLDVAAEKGWVVVDMKKDFNKVFSYE